jgi:hypothetical protein
VEGKLSLPSHFKIIFNFMTQLDQILMFFKSRRKPAYFEDLKPSIETATHMTFNRSHFGQIVAVDPQLYTFQWENNNNRQRDLLITPSENLTDASTNSRKEKFAENLLKITERYYNDWCKT